MLNGHPSTPRWSLSRQPAGSEFRFRGSLSEEVQFGDEGHTIRDVWAWNFDQEFDALLAAVANSSGTSAVLALDMEFPGFLREERRTDAQAQRYQALRENVDFMWPIQLGVAVSSASGTLKGAWTFNLRFDAEKDHSSPSGMAFLRRVGVNFARHRGEGIPPAMIGRRLASSSLVGWHRQAPWWLTFSGSYDLGFLLKLLSCGRPLPGEASSFDKALSVVCPWRHELRDQLPKGSLEALGKQHGIIRRGQAHTAGSDALLTLELFMQLEYTAYLQKDADWSGMPTGMSTGMWPQDFNKYSEEEDGWNDLGNWASVGFGAQVDEAQSANNWWGGDVQQQQPQSYSYAYGSTAQQQPAPYTSWPDSYASQHTSPYTASSDWYTSWGIVS
jgi:CCR4-NOT transcription complex subunit 7/8